MIYEITMEFQGILGRGLVLRMEDLDRRCHLGIRRLGEILENFCRIPDEPSKDFSKLRNS